MPVVGSGEHCVRCRNVVARRDARTNCFGCETDEWPPRSSAALFCLPRRLVGSNFQRTVRVTTASKKVTGGDFVTMERRS